MFPLEIFKLLSYRCKPNTFAVNKELGNIYIDEWYYDYLKIICEENIDDWKENWKELYIRYRKSYKMIHTNNKGEKVTYLVLKYHPTRKLLLTFDGKLFNIFNDATLVSNNVNDILDDYYITQYEVFDYTHNYKIFISPYKLLSCLNYNPYIRIILSTHGIYIHGKAFIPIDNCKSMALVNNNVIVTDINSKIHILPLI